jgi:hypothetical protein
MNPAATNFYYNSKIIVGLGIEPNIPKGVCSFLCALDHAAICSGQAATVLGLFKCLSF